MKGYHRKLLQKSSVKESGNNGKKFKLFAL